MDGIPPLEGQIDFPIIESNSQKGKMTTAKKGMQSKTTFRTIESYGSFSLVEVQLHTGRQHQIRVHMSAIGHPLMVDPLYGRRNGFFLSEIKRKYKRSGYEEKPLMPRHTLHAYSIRFMLPSNHQEVFIEAELPKDMRAVINQLKKHMR